MKVRCAWVAVLLAGLALGAGCLTSADVSGIVLLSGGTRSLIRAEASPAVSAAPTSIVAPESVVPGEIVVSYGLQDASQLADPIIARLGGRRLRNGRDAGEAAFAVYRFPHAAAASEARARLERIPGVKRVEPNYRVQTQGTVDTSSELPDTLWNLKRVRVPGAWDITEGRPDIVVAVLDTGFALDHPNLAGAWTEAKRNFVDAGRESDPSVFVHKGDFAHGTHVAGIIGARTGAGEVVGVAPGVRLMPVKVLSDSGSGNLANVAAGIKWAADNGANIINLSLGGGTATTYMEEAIQYAHDHGVVIVAAAGNSVSGSEPVNYPARNPYVIAVGAVDASDSRATFSNAGKELDVMAPGAQIYSTVITDSGMFGYDYMNGTSMAAPHISGLVALMMSAGMIGPDHILSLLKSTAIDLGSRGFDSEYGYGRVDAFAATALPLVQLHLRSAIDNSPVSGPVHPSPSGQFVLRGQTGTFRLSGWVDVNNDGQIGPGDFYGEYPAPVIIPGRNRDLFLPLALLD